MNGSAKVRECESAKVTAPGTKSLSHSRTFALSHLSFENVAERDAA